MTPHPLDPLTETEIRHVQLLLQRERGVARPAWRIASIELAEPAKDVVRGAAPATRWSAPPASSRGTPGTARHTSACSR